VEAWPESLREMRLTRDGNPRWPLHDALSDATISLDVIQYLIQQWPESVNVRIDDECIALHLACRIAVALPNIQFLVEQFPESVKMKSSYGLPLHYGCVEPLTSTHAVRYLLDSWPDSIVRDGEGCLPLHAAIQWNAQNVDMIALLIDQWPLGVRIPWSDKIRVPLHTACREQAPLSVLQALVQAWPDAIRLQDADGLLPLHHACMEMKTRRGGIQSLSKIQFLVETWPKSLQVKTHSGMLALHWA